jgi:hypothetical protein
VVVEANLLGKLPLTESTGVLYFEGVPHFSLVPRRIPSQSSGQATHNVPARLESEFTATNLQLMIALCGLKMGILEVFGIRCSNSPPSFDEQASPILATSTYRYLDAGRRWRPTSKRYQPKQKVNIRISKTSNFRVSEYPSLMPSGSYHIALSRCQTSRWFHRPLPIANRSISKLLCF